MQTSLFSKTHQVTHGVYLAVMLMVAWLGFKWIVFNCLVIGWFTYGSAISETLLPPKNTPTLIMTGRVQISNIQGSVLFDEAILEALEEESFITSSATYTNPQRFSGVSLEKRLQAVGATGQMIEAKAFNNCSGTIPRSDLGKYYVVAAMKLNDEPMGVHEKGPLSVIYPFDTDPELASAGFHARSVWQSASLEVI